MIKMILTVAAAITGGSAIGSVGLNANGLPNPEVGECVFADVIFDREEPTLIDPDGAVTGVHGWQVCGYQVPTGVGSNVRAVDSQFYFELDQDAAVMLVQAADDIAAGDDVFLHD